jgi:hypothetical protein
MKRARTCAGSVTLERLAGPQPETIHAARGTACHEVAERALRYGFEPRHYLGTSVTTKEHKIEIDDELVTAAGVYVNHVRASIGRDDKFWIEEKFSLDALNTAYDSGGTADCVIYHPETLTLEVKDLKNGMAAVEVVNNDQLRTYALGAILAHAELKVSTVKVTIVQPRAYHKDGAIRSEEFSVVELLEWSNDMLADLQKAKRAEEEYHAAEGNAVLLDEWAETYLKPGDCYFCAARPTCPALRKQAFDVAGVFFDDFDKPRIKNSPDTLSPESLAQTLDTLDQIEEWVKAVRAYAQAKAEAGETIPGYVLQDKFGLRKWAAPEDKVVRDLKVVAGLSEDQVYDKKLKSPSAIEKLLGKEGAKKIACMWSKPKTGQTLVRADTASSSRAADLFANVEM